MKQKELQKNINKVESYLMKLESHKSISKFYGQLCDEYLSRTTLEKSDLEKYEISYTWDMSKNEDDFYCSKTLKVWIHADCLFTLRRMEYDGFVFKWIAEKDNQKDYIRTKNEILKQKMYDKWSYYDDLIREF